MLVSDEKPGYDEGRETMFELPPKSASEIMSNNPPFNSRNSEENKDENEEGYLTSAIGFLKRTTT